MPRRRKLELEWTHLTDDDIQNFTQKYADYDPRYYCPAWQYYDSGGYFVINSLLRYELITPRFASILAGMLVSMKPLTEEVVVFRALDPRDKDDISKRADYTTAGFVSTSYLPSFGGNKNKVDIIELHLQQGTPVVFLPDHLEFVLLPGVGFRTLDVFPDYDSKNHTYVIAYNRGRSGPALFGDDPPPLHHFNLTAHSVVVDNSSQHRFSQASDKQKYVFHHNWPKATVVEIPHVHHYVSDADYLQAVYDYYTIIGL